MRTKQLFLTLALLLTAVTGAWADDGIYCTTSDVGRVVCTDGSIYDNVSAAEADGKTAVAMIAYHDTVNKKALALALADESMMQWSTAISTCSAKTPTVTGGTWKLATRDEWDLMITVAGSDTALRNGFSSVGGTNMQSGQYWSSTEKDSGHAWLYDFRFSHWYSIELATANDKYVRACLDFDFTALTYPVKMADNWNVVYWRTQTKQSDWTALSAGSTTGRTLGSAGNTTYYYVTSNLSFTNSTAGGSGLTILGTVYLYIPTGVTLTCTGANASGLTGGGAGIELTAGNSLYLIGGGTLNANGGNAANGGNGSKGNDAEVTYNESILGGSGGTGGNGGGGAGAGIGTRGGNGGSGGSGGQRNGSYGQETTQYGVDGSAGTAGATAGAMGTLYGYQALAPWVNVNGGNAGSNGTGGSRGKTASQHPGSNVYMASGGGGGGGGGGAAGNVAWVVYSGTANGYYHAGAYGGAGGTNADGTTAPNGADVELDNPKHADIEGGGLRDSASDYKDDAGWENGNGRHDGGAGGGSGHASSNGSAVNLVLWPTQGAGTEESPYLISSADDWNTFVTNVSNGISFSGKVIKLTNDISVSNMAGSYQADDNYQPFSGIFDGDDHTLTINVSNQSRFAAPFKCVSGAIIKNLRTTGTIDGTGNADGKLLAGIIGVSFGNTTITGCRSSVTLTTDFGEDAALAGIVAGTKGGNLTIEGCVFDGSMTGSSNTRCAGIAGYEYGGTTTVIRNSLFAPTTLTISTADDTYTKTFTRDPDATITNCYYTQPLGAAQGTAAMRTVQPPVAIGTLVHDYGFMNAYQHGILFDGLYYLDSNYAPAFQLLKAATSGDVGKVVCAAGHLHDAKTAVPYGCTAVGILGRMTADGYGRSGLIIALQDAASQTWHAIDSWTSVTAYAGTTLKLLPDDNARGSLTSYTTLGETTVSNWCVAQKSDYEAIFEKLGSTTGDNDGKTYDANVNAYITTGVGGTAIAGYYWSATEYATEDDDTHYGWGFAKDGWWGSFKTDSKSVRPVLGFTFIASELPGTGTAGDPYTISNSDEWTNFAYNVNSGNNYNGKYVKLTNDISVSIPAGDRVSDSDNKPFSGTFLGDGHTITAALAIDGKQGLAPFRSINGATIRDLKVAGTIASNQNHTAGIAGFASGTNTIEDCLVTATLNISSDYAGGIIGHGLNSNTTIRGCVFAGTINGVDGSRNNIGGIWGWSNSGTPTLLNCLENGTYTNIASMHPMGLQKAAGTITNCYYMNPQVGSPQNACTVSGAKQAYTAATAPANRGKLVQDYGTLTAYENGILYDGKYYVAPASISLANAADNSTTITGADGYVANVTLAARTLYKDGKWNTLCLPFNVTLSGSPLNGAVARPLTSASISGSTLTLTFGDAVTTLVAGTPYIIKWPSGDDIVNPVFNGVTIDATERNYDNAAEGDARVRFIGTYSSTTFSAADNSILLMGGENKLYYPATGAGIGAQRAYFKIGDGAQLARSLTSFSIDFGEGDNATGIINVSAETRNNADGWYSLDGRKLVGKPRQNGIYINNGKKVVIK